MKTIFADYNAATASGDLRLNFSASQKDIALAQLQPGDWGWLCDGEVMVGAQLAIDDRHGLVGIPDWDTIVHFDDEGVDYDRVTAELNPLLTKEPHSLEDEPRIFQLLTQLEHFAPPLRAARISQARQAFESAQLIYPAGPMLDQLGSLQTYDHHAREVALACGRSRNGRIRRRR